MGRERERARGRHMDQLPLAKAPTWDLAHKHRHRPWMGIKPATFQFAGGHPTPWTTPVRAEHHFLGESTKIYKPSISHEVKGQIPHLCGLSKKTRRTDETTFSHFGLLCKILFRGSSGEGRAVRQTTKPSHSENQERQPPRTCLRRN